jgi:hypothetical protein
MCVGARERGDPRRYAPSGSAVGTSEQGVRCGLRHTCGTAPTTASNLRLRTSSWRDLAQSATSAARLLGLRARPARHTRNYAELHPLTGLRLVAGCGRRGSRRTKRGSLRGRRPTSRDSSKCASTTALISFEAVPDLPRSLNPRAVFPPRLGNPLRTTKAALPGRRIAERYASEPTTQVLRNHTALQPEVTCVANARRRAAREGTWITYFDGGHPDSRARRMASTADAR